MAHTEATCCCALDQLCCTNGDIIKDIKDEIVHDGSTLFAITTEKERVLEKRLSKIGFKHIHTFPSVSRHSGDTLKMWIYTAEKKSS